MLSVFLAFQVGDFSQRYAVSTVICVRKKNTGRPEAATGRLCSAAHRKPGLKQTNKRKCMFMAGNPVLQSG